LRLRELSVSGGATRFDVRLPLPQGEVHVCLDGGVNRVELRHPSGTAVELRLFGGANRLRFEDQRFGAVGGDLRPASPGWDAAADRYVIEARGGASRLAIQRV